ncbi:glycosyltransferase family 2 protein [Hyphomonas adhaerens]|uniref:Family 2 glycosyl transferase n=1 Tax=Hyphomonas adhaerens MHS-3 TaxID=1280949 RepID=A0A069E585_9PROT|nr:glycosyltransferase [Hyphomonas adhaerens]KCZ85197.1 family 2 glycosyl transferase [Hyphomonas adhaerens MHS-3]|tara:strand:- start:53 stop:1150 length:1098 start_codon:yes stop_codon:yes gene_type:complete
MTEATTTKAKATIVMTARDRFSMAVRALNEIAKVTAKPYDLIYVDGGSPKSVADDIRATCETHGFRYLRYDHYLAPCQARNIGHSLSATPYVVYCENDVLVTEGWLANLVACAEETGAEVVQPLICQGTPLHTEIHQAGGNFTDDMDAFFNGTEDQRRLSDSHLWHQGEQVGDVELVRTETQVTEVHCFLVRRDSFEWLGEFDENMPCSKDHVDFSVNVWSKGGRIMLEPSSIVTFCVPSRVHPVEPVDRAFFLLRWSPKWQRQSLNHFQKKWKLENDPYFDRYLKLTGWRYREGVAKPLIRKIPFIGHSYKVQQAGSFLLMPLLKFIGARLSDQQAQDYRPSGPAPTQPTSDASDRKTASSAAA